MRDHVLFYVNGRPHRARGADALAMLSDHLRQNQRLTGTKIVCAEGDCGACSVLVGRVEEGDLRYRPVCSCVLPVSQVDAAHVVTVEGLRYGEELNPIQRSFVACHGAQCGFCTPGFVVALQGMAEDGAEPTRESVRRELVGNLCRCTGYESILESACSAEWSAVRKAGEIFDDPTMRAELAKADVQEMRVEHEGRVAYKPKSIATAVSFKAEHAEARGCTVLAGSTDVGVGVNKRKAVLGAVLSTLGLPRAVRREGDALELGAASTLQQLEEAAEQHLPELAEYLQRFASPLIRNGGTPVGNVVTGSPIGDLLPVLLVLGTDVHIAGPRGERSANLNAFYTGYRTSVLQRDELVTGLRIPLLPPNSLLRVYKISKRKDLDISTVSAAFCVTVENGVISAAKIALGGVAATPVRSPAAEAFLAGKPLDLESLARAGEIAEQNVTPLSDFRGSAEYRRTLVRNLFLKLAHDVGGGPK